MRKRLALVGILACLGSPANAAETKVQDCSRGDGMKNAALAWKPTDQIAVKGVVTLPPDGSAAPAPPRIQVGVLKDLRENPQRVGENREDMERGCVYPVIVKDDVPAWAADRLAYVLKHLGFEVTATDGDVFIDGELREFFVAEGGTYDGQIGMKLNVKSKSGKALWSGLVGGSNGRWGKSYKLANYQETLSDAMIDLAQKLAADPGFTNAVNSRD